MNAKSIRPLIVTTHFIRSYVVNLKLSGLFLGVLLSSSVFAGAGDLDPTFGDGGKVVTDVPQAARIYTADRPSPLIEQPDGKMLVAAELRLWRLNIDGSLDQSFGASGEANLSAPAKALALQPDGKVIVGVTTGNTWAGRASDWGLVRVLHDGRIDSSFGDNGMVTVDFGATAGDYFDGESFERIEGVFVQDDGRILLVGSVFNGPGLGGGIGFMMFGPDGALDLTFGQSGRQFFEPDAFGTLSPAIWGWHSPVRVAEQVDGKLVLASITTATNPNDTVYLMRLNSEGSVDVSFGQSGVSTYTKHAYPYPEIGDIEIVNDGRIFVLASMNIGGRNNNPSILAFNADGTFDQGFGNEGLETVDLSVFGDDPPSFDYIDIKGNGSIVLGGTRLKYEWGNGGLLNYYNDLAVLALNPDATIDTGFGANGMVSLSLSEYQRQLYARSVTLTDDGKIVVAGPINHFPGGTTQFPADDVAVVRLDSGGAEDLTFGTGGTTFLTAHVKADNGAQDVVLSQADGKIIVGGFHRDGDTLMDFQLARYNDDGSLDVTFGGQGYVTTDFRSFYDSSTELGAQHIQSNDSIASMALQADGKIVVAGSSVLNNNHIRSSSFALARYKSNGELDSSFGEGGKVITDFLPEVEFEPQAGASDLVLQPDGKIIVVGSARNRPGGGAYEYEMAIARYNSNGTLDIDFGNSGQVIINRELGYHEGATSVALQVDGKILIAGSYAHRHFWLNDDGMQIARLNASGTLDTGFGDGGVVTTDIGYAEEIGDIKIQQDGRIVIGGVTFLAETYYDMLLARYAIDGSLDASFGLNGLVTFDFGNNWPGALPNGTDEINSIETQADGQVVAAGYTARWLEDPMPKKKDLPQYTQSYDFALLRVEETGGLDYSFGYGGKVTADFGTLYSIGRSVGIQADGKILVVGEVARDVFPEDPSLFYPFDYDVAIARFEGVNTKLDEIDALVFHTQNLARGGVVNEGQANALLAKLRAANQQVDRGNYSAAANQLGAFIDQISAFMHKGLIAESEAAFLIEETEVLINLISH